MTTVMMGIGTAVPEVSLAQTTAYQLTSPLCCDSDEHRRVMEMIYEGSGVQERRTVALYEQAKSTESVVDSFYQPRRDEDDHGPTTRTRMEKYEEHSLGLAKSSSQSALAKADLDPSAVTHIVSVSCSGFCAPGFDIGLIQELGLSRDVSRTHVGFMGCHGSFNALRVARGYTESDPNAVVLVCSVELCSLHHYYGWSTEKVIANALFADGSGAVICRQAPAGGAPLHSKYRLIRNASYLLPNSLKAMSWRIGDNGFEMTLSQKVPRLIEENLEGWMTQFLAKENLRIEDVRGWAIHPGGPRILDSCIAALDLDGDHLQPSREVLSNYGNMSSATILFVLDRMRQQVESGPVVALGFGPGLTIEAMLLHAE
jgi:predicted naringenin-chalcone synthase